MIPLLTIGLNHHTAPVEVRERVSFAPEIMVSALRELVANHPVDEAAILSTCNRTEIYIAATDPTLLWEPLIQWLANYHDIASDNLRDFVYFHEGEATVRHMIKVACGLDSMVLGEPQILGQMKSSYAVAREAGVLGSELHSAFQRVFGAAKQVRTKTAIGRNPVSVAYAATTLAEHIFSDLQENQALLIGAGETIDLAARHLREKGVTQIVFANRTLERAQILADEFSASAILLSDIPEYLHRADIIISSTASQLPILGKGAVESALRKRKHKPMFILDIAVPRDIEPQVGELSNVYLFTVDDLRDVIDENKQARKAAAEEAYLIIEKLVADYMRERRTRYSVATIKSYREYADRLKDESLQKALKALQNGSDPQQVVQELANRLTNKLLHSPTQQLKQASETGQDHILAASQQILGFPVKKTGRSN
ncbi:MAG: glutamyl-tRNA reductase [Cellvibrionaceae bacterium]|jgi:glutamyl-tRNA reductase